MRPWHDYGRRDWQRLRPFTQGLKTLRYNLINKAYLARPAPEPRALSALVEQARGRTLAISLAYNSPWIIGWQQRFCARNLRDAMLVVADNSSAAPRALEIRAICAGTGTPYLRLPRNPYVGYAASRSHGLALNWVYTHVVRRAQPPVFAFLDHDLLPLAPVRLADMVADQPVYGRLVDKGGRWYLWAGFCIFTWAAVAERRLDFRQDWFNGLDTGGANWQRLYRHLDRSALRFAHPASDPLSSAIERFDGWLHTINASHHAPVAGDKEATVDRLLERYWRESAA